ncbi:cyclic pyranopterin monophosphate synthase MoaC [Enterococcus caccae]|uniref:Cyclic pyranopterin monophosphate synthase n=1 Tax=Enterococcus caccae ATCC BAA-1240 TaxID=1158612 RepID=R3WEV1_9ENTE|nr:cyclic pyranopterin monophosphate synthase MoaC [Enterococcus caccae]EOL46386.1 molybdenum cofactor biosynthesis protein C [Enterococcus caccae ATCC BAA-1240]EOT60755.1 molybdenum cofactor biosynthesis protein C [Enterococcus caccae ATCC BAA-1240]OJG27435.1 molybdenum cofactor biosynthesis protein C [Enterococcus caccae]
MKETLQFTHITDQGQARMVDVSKKEATERTAIAYGEIHMNKEVALEIRNQTIKKGEVLQVARIAGIMAAKKTFELIPLCHVLALTKCEVDFNWKTDQILSVHCVTKTVGPTGVEMEALTGVNIALLTVYDMCKAMDREMNVTNIRLVEKSGGKSGHFISTNQDID